MKTITYGVMDYDEYYGVGEYNQTPCQAEHLGKGWTRISMLRRSKRVR